MRIKRPLKRPRRDKCRRCHQSIGAMEYITNRRGKIIAIRRHKQKYCFMCSQITEPKKWQ